MRSTRTTSKHSSAQGEIVRAWSTMLFVPHRFPILQHLHHIRYFPELASDARYHFGGGDF